MMGKSLRPLLLVAVVHAFVPSTTFHSNNCVRKTLVFQQLPQNDVMIDSDAPAAPADSVTPPPVTTSEAVKLFGKLAEKYIMLDATGGMCCYSGCSDCEFREPGGGYRMADQSSSRPKWIPTYEHRKIGEKEHTSKWSSTIFDSTKSSAVVVTKQQFVQAVREMSYAPILGGPSVAASAAAAIDDTNAIERLFGVLCEGKDVLTKHRMTVRLKQISGGAEGLVWPQFLEAIGAK